MASFKVEWKPSAEKKLKKIDKQNIPRILKAVELLSENPFPEKCRKLVDSEASYRIRVGDYRVIYQVYAGEKVVCVYHVRHRKDVYRRL